ncbi:MAG: hypothetical protein ACW967_08730 [Candidatus Hodarchaeales archaeon]|jgi:hypothetical protein
MSTTHENIFIEERDLPRVLELSESEYLPPEETWVKCYCNTVDITWSEPNCGSIKCLRRSYDFTLNSLTTYSSDHNEISILVNEIPITLLRLLTSEKSILNSTLLLEQAKIETILSYRNIPLELLLYIYKHRPFSLIKEIYSHQQFLNHFLDHILRKKLDSKEIKFLQTYPTLIAQIFWVNKGQQKWKQSFNRFFNLPYLHERSLAYILRCALNSTDENKFRMKIDSNPKMQRITNEVALIKTYNKISEYSVHWFWKVRKIIAQSEITQKRVLEALSHSSGYYSNEIKLELIKNASTPPKIIQNILINQIDKEIIIAALKRPDLSKRTYESFLNSDNDSIKNLARLSVAALSQIPKNLLYEE